MTEALGLNSPASPRDRVPVSIYRELKICASEDLAESPLDCSSAEVRCLRILPIRPTSFTTPHPTNTAHVSIARASISGVVSEEKAGVRAAVMGAWCCSRSRASV